MGANSTWYTSTIVLLSQRVLQIAPLQNRKQLFLSLSAPRRQSPPLTQHLSPSNLFPISLLNFNHSGTLLPTSPMSQGLSPLPRNSNHRLISSPQPQLLYDKGPPYIGSCSTQGTMSFFHPCSPWSFTPFWETPGPQAHRHWGLLVWSSQIWTWHLSEASCFVNIKRHKINNHLSWPLLWCSVFSPCVGHTPCLSLTFACHSTAYTWPASTHQLPFK